MLFKKSVSYSLIGHQGKLASKCTWEQIREERSIEQFQFMYASEGQE